MSTPSQFIILTVDDDTFDSTKDVDALVKRWAPIVAQAPGSFAVVAKYILYADIEKALTRGISAIFKPANTVAYEPIHGTVGRSSRSVLVISDSSRDDRIVAFESAMVLDLLPLVPAMAVDLGIVGRGVLA